MQTITIRLNANEVLWHNGAQDPYLCVNPHSALAVIQRLEAELLKARIVARPEIAA